MNVKAKAKHAISAMYHAASRVLGRKGGLTILYYHEVPEACASGFETQMRHLKAVATIVPPDFVGEVDPRRPAVAITFDDAFRSVREHALPVLERHGIQATIFVPTGWMGRRPGWAMESAGSATEIVMSGEELASLPMSLIAIGSHTVDHPKLSQLGQDEIEDQLSRSKVALEALLSRPVNQLAFPYGDHDARVVEVAQRLGYRFVYTVAPERIEAGSLKVSRGRTAVDPAESIQSFNLKLRGAYAWMPIASRIKRAVMVRS